MFRTIFLEKKLRTIRTDDALDTISYRGSLHAKPMISY